MTQQELDALKAGAVRRPATVQSVGRSNLGASAWVKAGQAPEGVRK